MKTRINSGFLIFVVSVILSQPAYSFNHFMQIEQVIGGVNGDVTAQAVQLRMRTSSQQFISGTRIRVRDASGANPITLITFGSNVTGGTCSTNNSRILIASTNFNSFTSPAVAPDFTLGNLIPESYLAAGSLTFESSTGTVWWRISWGGAAYTGDTTGALFTNDDNGDFGPPFPGPLPSTTLQALQYQGTPCGASTTNEADYALSASPAVFTNNSGQSFTVTVPTPTGACCDDSTGTCTEGSTQAECEGMGFRYGSDSSTCMTINPACTPPPTGACCDDSTGMCLEGQTEAACLGLGMSYRYGGDDSTCMTINPPCTPPPFGACCNEATGFCDDGFTQEECESLGRSYLGDGTTCETLVAMCEPPLNPPIPIGLEVVAEGLTAPVYLTHAGDGSGRLFILDQIGQIRIVKDGVLLPTPFLDLTSKIVELNSFFDERGLLGLAFHPNYAINGRFFVRYSAPRAGDPAEPCNQPGFIVGCHEAILAEYNVLSDDPATSDVADPSTEIILFRVDEPQFNHNSGQVAFGPDGLLYWTLGDGGGAHDGLADGDPPGSAPSHGPIGNGQNTNTALGSLLRIDVDGTPDVGLSYSIPAGNPFAGGGGAPEIYAYGFRNPYRFSFVDFTDGGNDFEIIVADVGQNLFEEIDFVPGVPAPGLLNYGWVIREGFHCFDPFNPLTPPKSCAGTGPFGEPLIDPVLEYDHSVGIAVIGGYVYRGTVYPPLSGKYVFADFSLGFGVPSGRLFYTDIDGPDAFILKEFFLAPEGNPLGKFMFGIGEDESGELYALASGNLGPTGNAGVVFKLVPPTPILEQAGSRYIAAIVPPSTSPMAIAFSRNCEGGAELIYVGASSGPSNVAFQVALPGDAAFLTSLEWGQVVNIAGLDITSASDYNVQIDYGIIGVSALSSSEMVSTYIYCDSTGEDGGLPDGVVSIIDVLASVRAWLGDFVSIPLVRVDVISLLPPSCLVDQSIDIGDVLQAVNAWLSVPDPCAGSCP